MEQQLRVGGDLVRDQEVEVPEAQAEQEPVQRRVQRDARGAAPGRRRVRRAADARDVELGLPGPGHDVVVVGLAEVDPRLRDVRRPARGHRRKVTDPQLGLALAGDRVHRHHREPDAVRVDDLLVDPAPCLRVAVDRQLAAREHHLAHGPVDQVAVGVDVVEVVVLAHGLELVERRLERPVVPQTGVGERVRLGDDGVGGQRLGPRVALLDPLVEAEREARHRDVVRDEALLLGVLVGIDRQPLDGLGVDAPEHDRRREPDDHDRAERPHPLRERARDEQGASDAGQEREHVVGEEARVEVRVRRRP